MCTRMAASLRVAARQRLQDGLVFRKALGDRAGNSNLIRRDHHVDGFHGRRQVWVSRQLDQPPVKVAIGFDVAMDLFGGRPLAEAPECLPECTHLLGCDPCGGEAGGHRFQAFAHLEELRHLAQAEPLHVDPAAGNPLHQALLRQPLEGID